MDERDPAHRGDIAHQGDIAQPRDTQPTAPPRFVYFDLGNVLLTFDHHRAARQMASVAGITPQAVWELVFSADLELRYERGELSTADFHSIFCQHSGTQPGIAELVHAASDIFEPNLPVIALLEQLQQNGHRLGLLSNTNDAHWSFILTTYPDLPRWFEVIALSFELKSLKPEPEIYRAAASLAGVDPAEILFIDDRPENVSGARAARIQAIQYTDHRHLVAELTARGLGPLV